MAKVYNRNGWQITRNIQPSRNGSRWSGYHSDYGFCYANTLRGMFQICARGAINPYVDRRR